MRSEATTAADYLAGLPEDRRAAITTVRDTILEHLPDGYVERISFGMLAYEVPLSAYPDTYNKQPLMYAALASQKSHMALYLCSVQGSPALEQQLAAGFAQAGKRLDMGKSCVRFKKLDDLPLPAIAQAIAATPMQRYIEQARATREGTKPAEKPAKKPAAKKPTRKPAAKKLGEGRPWHTVPGSRGRARRSPELPGHGDSPRRRRGVVAVGKLDRSCTFRRSAGTGSFEGGESVEPDQNRRPGSEDRGGTGNRGRRRGIG